MPPDDPTPLGDAMTHRFPEQKIPEPEPGSAQAREQATDIKQRPALPDQPRPTRADGKVEGDAAGHGKRTELERKLPAKQRG
jgi:hypothetical protein